MLARGQDSWLQSQLCTPSLCSLVLFMPVSPPVSFGVGPGDPFPPDMGESSGIPESTLGLLRGNKSRLPGLGGAAIQAGLQLGLQTEPSSHYPVVPVHPRPPPPLLGGVSADPAHDSFFAPWSRCTAASAETLPGARQTAGCLPCSFLEPEKGWHTGGDTVLPATSSWVLFSGAFRCTRLRPVANPAGKQV